MKKPRRRYGDISRIIAQRDVRKVKNVSIYNLLCKFVLKPPLGGLEGSFRLQNNAYSVATRLQTAKKSY